MEIVRTKLPQIKIPDQYTKNIMGLSPIAFEQLTLKAATHKTDTLYFLFSYKSAPCKMQSLPV